MQNIISCSNESLNDEVEEVEEKEEISQFSKQCESLQMISIPTFGKRQLEEEGEYNFLEPILILKSEAQPNNFPDFIKSKLDILKNKYPQIEQEYFHITLGSLLAPTSEEEINSSYTLLNLISQPYVFYNSILDDNHKEHKSEIYCAAFTDELELDTIKESEEKNDNLKINPDYDLDDWRLKRQVILQKGDKSPILYPNNCSILVNLNAQIINFYVVVCATYGNAIVRCFLGNFIIIPNANTSKLFKYVYKSFNKEKNKKEIAEELIIFKNKYNDFMNYIFSFGIDQIVQHADNINQIKICITKSFSFIFEFENEDNEDENSNKIYEKKQQYMQEYYYNNFLNFIFYLYENSRNVDPEFPEKYLECTMKKNFVEELLVKYKLFNIKRVNQIISNYLFFIYYNIPDDLEEKAKEKYDEEILSKVKNFFQEKLDKDEETLNEIKDNYSEESRIHIKNPYKDILINICNDIPNEDKINLEELDEIIQKYLFYIVWKHKGEKKDVHNDFGRVSFMNIEIDKMYFCNNDDKIDCCQKLIEYLDKADEKEF